MLKAGQTSTVKFNVDVHGTSTVPEVRLIIAIPEHELGFKCLKVGDQWQTDITIPEGTPTGKYNMRVEVNLNGRLFTPLKRHVDITDQDVTVAAAFDDDVNEPDATEIPPTFDNTPLNVPEPVRTTEPAPRDIPRPPSLAQSFEAIVQKKTIGDALVKAQKEKAKQAEKPVVKKPIETPPLPKGADLKAKITVKNRVSPRKAAPVHVKEHKVMTIADIVAESDRLFADLEKSPTYVNPTKVVKAFEMKTGSPVSLVKGDIIYE